MKEISEMKLNLGWAEFGLAVFVALASVGGSYAATRSDITENSTRIEKMEVTDARVIALLEEYIKVTNQTNIVLGRLDERLKYLEKRGQ